MFRRISIDAHKKSEAMIFAFFMCVSFHHAVISAEDTPLIGEAAASIGLADSDCSKDFFSIDTVNYIIESEEDQNGSVPGIQPVVVSVKMGGWFWLSPLIVFVGIALNFFIYNKNTADKKREQQASVIDDYWLRKIIIPDIKDTIERIRLKQSEYWNNVLSEVEKSLYQESFQDYLDGNLFSDTHLIAVKIEKLSFIDSAMQDRLVEVVDSFEGTITSSCEEFEGASQPSEQRIIARKVIHAFELLQLDLLVELINPHQTFAERSRS